MTDQSKTVHPSLQRDRPSPVRAGSSESKRTDEGEVQQKATVHLKKHLPALTQEFDKGDQVKLTVREKGFLRAKKMAIVRAEFRQGRWMYQVTSGVGVHRDERGNDWFSEKELDWW